MSDGESSQGFQLDDSGSEGYIDSPKVKKVAKKAAPQQTKVPLAPSSWLTKQASGKKATKAALAPKKNLPNDSISEDESSPSSSPAKPRSKPDDGIVEPGPKPKKTASEMYQKVSP
jgi:hypothetical protein